jgi:hypothetical protein
MPDMPELSRRSLITKASLGAAAAGALVAVGGLGERADAATPAAKPATHDLAAPVVAHVTDLRSGTVHLYTGEHGVTVVDHALAQSLARAAQH